MKVLIIDDSQEYIDALRMIISKYMPQYEFVAYDPVILGKPDRDFNWLDFNVILLDYDLGTGEDGIQWLGELSEFENIPPIIILTSEGNEYVAVSAIKQGAVDYLNKSDLTPKRIINAINNASRKTLATGKGSASMTGSLDIDPDEYSSALSITTDKSGLIDLGAGYKFLRKIGEGAMSKVYLAERLMDNETIVLKLLELVSDVDDKLVTRFVQEAELLSTLNSPFVVKVYDYGITNDYAFIAMEFFSRGDLKQRMQLKPTAEIALTYLCHIAYGIDAIHNIGVVHRDLKPANIMFRGDDSLAIADFGIAKKLNTAFNITTMGQILGSPHYMSPEQGTGKEIGFYADIYSAGVILFELLAHRKPYSGSSAAEIIYQHRFADVPELPEELSRYQDLINRTMAKDPLKRYDSRRLILALEAALEEFS